MRSRGRRGGGAYERRSRAPVQVGPRVVRGAVTTDADGRVESIVTDVGGFFGLLSRRVALSATQVGVQRGADGATRLQLALSEQELRDLPEVPVRPIPPGAAGYRS